MPKYNTRLQPSRPFTHAECATILAALRNWQDITSPEGGNDPRELSAEHFEDGTKPLNTKQIDELCEAINLQPINKRPRNVDAALKRALAALAGNSNDAEHDALINLVESLTSHENPPTNSPAPRARS